MSDDFSDGTDDIIPAMTIRGRDWPHLCQFCVFLENRVGRLHELMRLIEKCDLRVIALSVVDTVDFAVVRIMVDDSERAREVFELSEFTTIESDILGVVLAEDYLPFVSIFQSLLSAELNVCYTYPLLYRRGGHGAIAIFVDDIDRASQVLRDLGHELLSEGDLKTDDEYF